MRTVGPRLAAGLIAAGLVLAGCGGSAEPKQLPAPSKSSSPSASPSDVPAPPVLPEAAKAKTKDSAIAFARHYVSLINYAQSTGRVDALKAVEDPGCRSCARADAYLADLYQRGGAIRGGEFRIQGASALRNPATQGWLVELGVRFGAQTIDHPSPTPDEHPDGGRLPLNVQVAWRVSGWRVLEWTRGA
jgi:hypothetical protein